MNDWYDGRIDRTYQRHCYDDALKHLRPDIEIYSSAHEDILRALQSATAKNRRGGKGNGPNALIVPPPGPRKDGKGTGNDPLIQPTGPKAETGASSVAAKLNPVSASSLPLPLLVLGGLALVLVFAGVAGLAAKHFQARRQGR
jgi:hypothetical protein